MKELSAESLSDVSDNFTICVLECNLNLSALVSTLSDLYCFFHLVCFQDNRVPCGVVPSLVCPQGAMVLDIYADVHLLSNIP